MLHSSRSASAAPAAGAAAAGRVAVLAGVATCTVLGAVLRFATLGRQSFEAEEAYTLQLLHRSFGGMLHGVARQESTPPLYYAAAWIWSRVFGTSEVGLRSLSALAGTLMIPVAYYAAATLLRRSWPALAVALLTAVSPILVWYSQEARAYALYALLSAASLLLFARLVERRSRADAWLWAAVAVLTIWTHYFAGFLVVAEAAVLLALPDRRRLLAPIGAVAALAAAAVPLAIHQYGSAAGLRSVTSGSLGWRLKEVALRFVFFYYNPGRTLALVVAIAAAAALVYLGRSVGRARLALGLGAATVVLPLLLAAAGILDVFFFRNVLAAWLPLVVAVAAGFARFRLAPVAAAIAALVLLGSTVQLARKVELQRDSWRPAVAALRSEPTPLFVTNDSVTPPVYWPGLAPLPQRGLRVRDVALAGRYVTAGSSLGIAGFRPVGFRLAGNIGILRLAAPHPLRIAPRELESAGLVAWVPPEP